MKPCIQSRLATVMIAIFLLSITLFSQSNSELKNRVVALEQRVSLLEARLATMNKTSKLAKLPTQSTTATLSQSVSPIRAKMFKKKLELAKPGDIDDNIVLLITFKNDGPIDIASFKSEVIVKTAQGDSLLAFSIDLNKQIKSQGNSSWYGAVTYNAADLGQRRLLNMNISQVLTIVRPSQIIYTDGTVRSVK